GSANVAFSGGTAEITEADLVITETPRSGWAVASHSGESVALDLTLDERLIGKGIVREAVRAIQDERKASGFDVSDRIEVSWNANTESAHAIDEAREFISEEVLALKFTRDEGLPISEGELGLSLSLKRA
ncbi:MAG: hypothetical protein RLY29_813, partial [Actinomycetota bacterium]